MYTSAIVLIFGFSVCHGFDMYTKITCNITVLKSKLDACTPAYQQPVYIFLPPSLDAVFGSSQTSGVSITGVDYQQIFLHGSIYRCQSEQRIKQEQQIKCRYNQMMACTQPDYQYFFPTLDRVREGMKYLCDHKYAVRQECEMGRLSDLNYCVKTKENTGYISSYGTEEENKMCSTIHNARECMEESLQECGQEDINLHLQVMDYFSPEFCSSSHQVTPEILSMTVPVLIWGLVKLFLKI